MKARPLTPSTLTFTPEELEQYALGLQKMIRCKTISVKNSFDDREFLKLRSVMEELFPLVHKNAQRMIFSQDCWIYRLPGRDTSRNIMLMSHHDVVAAEGNWDHEPFGGQIIDGKIWGRGTVDTKTPLFAEFAALEELLREGFTPECNIWIGSSHNEELGGDGIPSALAWFREQGIRFEAVLDEGGAVIEPPLGGMKCEKCAMVAVHEKGRYKLLFSADAASAHAGLTAATNATPAERMASFIHRISSKPPFIRRLNPQIRAMFAALSPYCGFPMKQLLGNLGIFGGLICKVLPKLNPQAGGLIGTTCSFSEICTDASRICTATAMLKSVDARDMEADIETLKTIAAEYGITVAISEDSEYHGPADMDQPAYRYTMECIESVFPQHPASPMILPAGTDARHLTEVCPCVLRFAPITLSKQQLASVHSENENLDLRSIGEAVVFYKRFLENYR